MLGDVKRAVVLGKGVSGTGAYEALRIAGVECALVGEDELGGAAEGADLIVVSPSVPRSHRVFSLAREYGAEVIGETELGFRLCSGKVVAVTGTNGKTTTAKLIGKILSATCDVCVTGNVGRSFALDATDGHEVYVVEMSSFQLENVRLFAPDVAVITSIAEDHLDRHGSMENYVAAKLAVARAQTSRDALVLNADDIPAEYLAGFTPPGNVVYVSCRGKVNGAYKLGERFYWFDEPICFRSDLKMHGLHNEENALAAIAAAKLMGARNGDIVRALGEFEPDDHRIHRVATVRGVTFYDDSKGTNVDASIKAVRSMPSSVALIAGGSDKGCGFTELFTELKRVGAVAFVTGATAKRMLADAESCGFTAVKECGSLSEAVRLAYESGAENVLLSPATASFDAYSSYEARGEAFAAAVRELAESEKKSN